MKYSVYLILLLIFVFSCDKSTNEKPVIITESTVKVPLFNADSAYYFIEKQVSFGPRVPNSSAHQLCANWMTTTLKKYNFNVVEQKFQEKAYDENVLDLVNIIAEYNPNAKKRILLAAHWDTRHIADRDTERQNEPILGANDGGSGVGVLLEIARVLSQNDLNIGVDIILFDGEDYGQPDDSKFPYMENSWCLGSQYWSRNKHKENYYPNYGILLDMVGAKNARFAKEGVSMYFAKNIVDKVWKTAHKIGYSDYFTFQTSEQITDDHLYVNQIAQIPMINIIEYSPFSKNGGYFGDYHHTHNDNMDIINKNTLKAVGQTLLEVIYNE